MVQEFCVLSQLQELLQVTRFYCVALHVPMRLSGGPGRVGVIARDSWEGGQRLG